MTSSRSVRIIAASATGAAVVALALPAGAATNSFRVTMRVTDATGAPTVDKALVNPWGMSQSPSGPVWVSDNGTGKSTLYTATAHPKVALTVTIPGGAPTGQVYNATSGFKVGGAPATFVFDSESGVVSGWNGGTKAIKATAIKGAVFKGLATASVGGKPRLYASDFHNGTVDVFNASWGRVRSTTAFVDRKLPKGYAPFGIAALAGRVFVSYAKQDSARHDDLAANGNGYVDVFSTSGTFVKRLISRGALNSPWGMTIAPKSFGPFGGALLVGNFGNGRINAYSATTGAAKGALHNTAGRTIVLPGLWGLLFGNGTSAAKTALMFTSGPAGESHGRWGTITAG